MSSRARSTLTARTSRASRRGPSAFPPLGPTIHGVGLRVLAAVVGIVMSYVVLPPQPAVLGAIAAVAAAVFPRALLAWVLMVALGIGLLAGGEPAAGDVPFHVALAGIPLLHLLSVWSVEVPAPARVQLRVLARPGLRYLGVQLVCQVVATVLLGVFASGRHDVPGVVVLALAALVVAAVMVVRALQAERA